MAPRIPPVVVCSAPNAAGALSVVDVREHDCTLSNGEVLLIRWAKLRALAEQVCQEQAPIWIRVWTTPAGTELIELHRVGAPATPPASDVPSSTVF
jgi:hypothetical protein